MKKQPITLGLSAFGTLLAIFALALNLSAQDPKPDDVIRVETSLVNIPVIVSDRNGRYIPGLKADNFSIFEDGKEQKIEYLTNVEQPINIAILIDTSRSTEDVLGKIKGAAKDFIKLLNPDDRAMIVSFDNNVEVLSDLTSDHKTLEKAINQAKIGNRLGTVMYDAVSEVIERRFAQVKGRKAIILLTDGKDFGSAVTKNELLYRAEETDTMIYSVFYETELPGMQGRNPFPGGMGGGGMGGRRGGMGGGRRGGMGGGGMGRFPQGGQRRDPDVIRRRNEMDNQQAKEYLKILSELTAGRAYQKDVADLDDTFALIADELRKQYLIGYYPEGEVRAGVHQVRVRIDFDGAVVRAKQSYRTKPAESPVTSSP